MAYKQNPGIYKIVNTVNGLVYIGSSNCIQRRWYEHKSTLNRNVHGNDYLQKAWSKYGAEAFEFHVLENCEVCDLVAREAHWINEYDAFNRNKGYNLTDTERRSLSEETKAKLSKAHKGKKLSEETKRKLSELNTGRTFSLSDEAKRRISEAKKGMTFSDEHRKNLSKAHKGKTFEEFSEKRKAGYSKAVKEGKFKKKLTIEQADEIRRLKADGVHYKEIMKMFNISDRTVYDVVNGKYHK